MRVWGSNSERCEYEKRVDDLERESAFLKKELAEQTALC